MKTRRRPLVSRLARACAATVIFGANTATLAKPAIWIQASQFSGGVAYVDSSSIRVQGARRAAWVKSTYQFPMEMPDADRKKYLMTLELLVADCAAGTSGLKVITYFADTDGGKVLATASWPMEEVRLEEVAPESIGESIHEMICLLKPRSRGGE